MNPPRADAPQAIRTFVAIALSGDLQEQVQQLQEQLRDALRSPPAFRWTQAGQVHLTLKFLGSIVTDALPELQEILLRAVAGSGPFELGAAGLGFFPDRRRPRVCWVGLEGDLTALRRLQDQVDRAAEPWVPREKKPFAPHLTLARVKDADRDTVERLAALPEELWRCRLGNWPVRELEFMQSELLPQGARHIRLASLPLTSAPA